MSLEKTDINIRTCQICGKVSNTKKCNAGHIGKTHFITPKQYYDKFFKHEQEDICIICGKKTHFNSFKYKYNVYCSQKCVKNDPKIKIKREDTNLLKYNSITPFGCKAVRDKVKFTNIKRYGVENVFQCEAIKEKLIQTNIKNYGVKNPSQAETIKRKKQISSLKKYGTNCVLQSKIIKEKGKQTCLKKYGAEYYFQTKEKLFKSRNSCIERYGVDNPTKNRDICERAHKNAKKSKPYILPSGKIIYKMGYEPQFLDYVFKNNILKEDEIDYTPKTIIYIGFDNKEHYYHPDFYIPKWNLIVEIKSDYIMLLDKEVYLKEEYTKKNGFNYIRIVNNKPKKVLDFIGFDDFRKKQLL